MYVRIKRLGVEAHAGLLSFVWKTTRTTTTTKTTNKRAMMTMTGSHRIAVRNHVRSSLNSDSSMWAPLCIDRAELMTHTLIERRELHASIFIMLIASHNAIISYHIIQLFIIITSSSSTTTQNKFSHKICNYIYLLLFCFFFSSLFLHNHYTHCRKCALWRSYIHTYM